MTNPTREEIEGVVDSIFPNFAYRPNQKTAILDILESFFIKGKKYVITSVSTGGGKSIIANHVAKVYNYITNRHTLTLTNTISLQNQYLRDFPEMRKLMGANNYDCSVDYAVPIPPSLKHHDSCKYSKDSCKCEYGRAKAEYNLSQFKLLNYAFYTTGIDTYNTNGLVVCDEAHNFEEQILNMLSMELDLLQLQELCLSYTPNHLDLQSRIQFDLGSINVMTYDLIKTLANFIGICVADINAEIKQVEESLEASIHDPDKLLKVLESRVNPLKKAIERLNFWGLRLSIAAKSTNLADDYSISFEENAKNENGELRSPFFAIKPVFIPSMVKDFIFGVPDKFLFLSATAERIKQSLLLSDEETDVYTYPYNFPLENRPTYAITNLGKLNLDTFESTYPVYCNVTDNIISQYPEDTNVIIHSVSYKNAEMYRESSKFKDRILIPTAEQVRDLVSLLKPGTIVVSPSITEGVDLGNGLARVQIFIKCPYPYLGDKWIDKKKNLDRTWYSYATLLDIIQGSGRGIRSHTDFSDTFILDPSFKRLLQTNSAEGLVPEWFERAVKYIEL